MNRDVHMIFENYMAAKPSEKAHPYHGPLTDLGGGYYWAAEKDGDTDDRWYNFFLLKGVDAANNLYKTISSFIKVRDYDLNLVSDESDRIKAWLKKNKGIDLDGEKIEANDEDAENMDNVSARMHAKQADREKQNPPHGYPQGMTAIQNLLMNELKKRGYKLTRVSQMNAETEGYPAVFMSKTSASGAMHHVVEISGMGEINGEPYKNYIANLKIDSEDEDAEDYVTGMKMPDFIERVLIIAGNSSISPQDKLRRILKMSFNAKRNLEGHEDEEHNDANEKGELLKGMIKQGMIPKGSTGASHYGGTREKR